MSAITDARAAMSDLVGVATGVQSFGFIPNRVTPPVAFVLPGTPYLESSGTFGTFTLNLGAYLVVDSRVNETGAQALDALVDDAVVALVNAGIGVEQVSEPFEMSSGGASYLAVNISTTQPVSL